ncbi:MAG: ROK family protein [Oceanicaulis sp.]
MTRLGVDLGGTKIEAALLSADGTILTRRRTPTPADYEAKIRAVAELAAAVEAETGLSAPHLGVGHPGSINPRTGLVRNANSTALNGKPLDRDLAESFGRPVACANDANCFALSESVDGAGAGAASVFGVITGTGVGGGYVLDGRLVEGADGIAAEWGHTALPRPTPEEVPGPVCKCGRESCVESWCSGPALSADHQRGTGVAMTAAEIAAAAADGDPECMRTIDLWVDRLARAMGTLVNIVDPEIIVLGGGLSNIDRAAERLEAALAPHCFTDEPRTKVRRNVHGDSSGVRGAAWLEPKARG